MRVSLLLFSVLVAGCQDAPAPAARTPLEVSRGVSIATPSGEVVAAPPAAPWAEGERFRVHLEQRGKSVPVTDHRAKLAREPFDIVMLMRVDEMRDAFSLSLHASTDAPELANVGRLGSGAPLEDTNFGDGSGVAEEWFDKEHALFARDGHHEIMWFGEQEHRCAHAVRTTHDTLSCTRTVQKLIEAGGNEVSIRETKELLLVFAKLDHRGARAVEKQRDWMVLRFE